LLSGRPGHVGRNSDKGNRLFVEAVIWKLRTCAPWRDLPERFGDWKNTHKRFRDWHGDTFGIEQLDGSVRHFRPGECWAAAFAATLNLSLKKPEVKVFDALRNATDESRAEFFSEFGDISTAIIGRNDEGIWAEAYQYDLDTDEVLCTYHPPGSEEAHAIFFEAAKHA
jgi:transposase